MTAVLNQPAGRVVIFTLPSLPPSTNIVYQPTRSVTSAAPRWEPRGEWRTWRSSMQPYVKVLPITAGSLVRCDTWFWLDRFYKNGKLRKVDVQNCLKYLIDTIADKQDWDDSVIHFGSWGSTHDTDNPRVMVKLTEVRQ